MAVSLDTTATGFPPAAAGNVTTISCTITVGTGSNRALIAFLVFGNAGTGIPAGTTVVYDPAGANQAMTLITGTTVSNSAGLSTTIAMYGLVNPTSGTSKSVTASGFTSQEVHITAAAYTGVDQTGGATSFPHGTTVNNTTATTSGSITVTSATGNMVAALFAQNAANMVSTNGTLIQLENVGANSTGLAATAAGAASINVTAAWGGTSTQNIACACDILAAVGGGGATLVGVIGTSLKSTGPRLAIGRARGPLQLGPIVAPPAVPTPTLVQAVGSTTNDNNGPSGNGFKFNLPNATLRGASNGNCLVLAIAYPFSSTRTISISDSTGDTWPAAALTAGTATTGHMNTKLYVLPNASAGLHTLTLTFDAAIKPFQYVMAEFNNLDISAPADGTNSAVAAGTAAVTGAWTPTTNNNGNGGHLIFTYAFSDDTVGTLVANKASAIATSNGIAPQLIHADNGCTIPSASSYDIQTANASINPGFAFTQSTGTNFVVASVALKVASAGQAAPSTIWVKRLLHCTCPSPSTGNNKFLFPCDGNLLLATMAAGNNLNVVNSVTLSGASGTFTDRTFGAGASQFFEFANATPSNSGAVTLNLNASEPQFSIHLWDITGAATSPFLNNSGITSGNTGLGTSLAHAPDHTPTQAPGLTVVQTGEGTAAQSSLISPSGTFDTIYYLNGGSLANSFDIDQMDNADMFGHYYYSTTAAQNWTWTITNGGGSNNGQNSTFFCTACSYLTAGANSYALSALSSAMGFGRLSLAGVVPLAGRAAGAQAQGLGGIAGSVVLSTRGFGLATARLTGAFALALAARATAIATGRLSLAGTLTIAARAAAMATGRAAATVTTSLISIAAAGAAMATGRATASLTTTLFARGQSTAKGTAAPTNTLTLTAAGKGNAKGTASPSGTVPLTATGTATGTGRASLIGSAALATRSAAMGVAKAGISATASLVALSAQGAAMAKAAAAQLSVSGLVGTAKDWLVRARRRGIR